MIQVCITDSEVIMFYPSASKKKLWRIWLTLTTKQSVNTWAALIEDV